MNELINDKAVYRTAPATTGLLMREPGEYHDLFRAQKARSISGTV